MPISVEFHPSRPELAQTFAKVLRDDPDYAADLELALGDGRDIVEAHFNGQPVGIAVLHGDNLEWMVVHPATRGRGVGRDFLRIIQEKRGHEVVLPEKCQE